MKLVRYGTKEEVKVGDSVEFRGETMTIDYAPKPHKPSSEGHIQAKDIEGNAHYYYASVFGCEWIEREDRR